MACIRSGPWLIGIFTLLFSFSASAITLSDVPPLHEQRAQVMYDHLRRTHLNSTGKELQPIQKRIGYSLYSLFAQLLAQDQRSGSSAPTIWQPIWIRVDQVSGISQLLDEMFAAADIGQRVHVSGEKARFDVYHGLENFLRIEHLASKNNVVIVEDISGDIQSIDRMLNGFSSEPGSGLIVFVDKNNIYEKFAWPTQGQLNMVDGRRAGLCADRLIMPFVTH